MGQSYAALGQKISCFDCKHVSCGRSWELGGAMRNGISSGLFERKEDGTTVYYGEMHGNGRVVGDKDAGRIKALYFAFYVTLFAGVFPLIGSGARLAGVVLLAVAMGVMIAVHRRLIRHLPFSPVPRPPLKQRMLYSYRHAPYWVSIGGVLSGALFAFIAWRRMLVIDGPPAYAMLLLAVFCCVIAVASLLMFCYRVWCAWRSYQVGMRR